MHISSICKTAYIVLLLKIVVFKLSSLNICFKHFTNLFSSSVHSGTLLTHFTHLPKYLENLAAEHNRTFKRIQMQESYLKYRESLFSYMHLVLFPKLIFALKWSSSWFLQQLTSAKEKYGLYVVWQKLENWETKKLDLPVFIILGKGSKIERLTGKFILNVEKKILWNCINYKIWTMLIKVALWKCIFLKSSYALFRSIVTCY